MSVIAFIVYFVNLWSQGRRENRGEDLALAIHKNLAVRFSNYLYILLAITSGAAFRALTPSRGASPEERLQAVLHADTVNIAIQIGVIAFLLLVVLGTGREIHKARASSRIGSGSVGPGHV